MPNQFLLPLLRLGLQESWRKDHYYGLVYEEYIRPVTSMVTEYLVVHYHRYLWMIFPLERCCHPPLNQNQGYHGQNLIEADRWFQHQQPVDVRNLELNGVNAMNFGVPAVDLVSIE
jgi:hypothetical protein